MNDHPATIATACADRHAVPGGLDYNLVRRDEAIAQTLERRPSVSPDQRAGEHRSPRSPPRQGSVDIHSDDASHDASLSLSTTGAAGDTTSRIALSAQPGELEGGQLTSARSSSCRSACPHLRAPGASVPDGRTIRCSQAKLQRDVGPPLLIPLNNPLERIMRESAAGRVSWVPFLTEPRCSTAALYRRHRMVRQVQHEHETTLSAASHANRSRCLTKCAKNCTLPRAVGCGRPQKPAPLQPLGKQARTLAIMPDHLQETAAASTKAKQLAAQRIAPQFLLHLQRQARKALPHVGDRRGSSAR